MIGDQITYRSYGFDAVRRTFGVVGERNQCSEAERKRTVER